MNLTDEIDELRQLRLERDDLKVQFEEADKLFKQQEQRVFELMDDEGVESVRVNGVLFSRVSTLYGHVNDRAKFLEWARDYDEELFESRERKQLVNEIVRERTLNDEPLPPGVGLYVRDYISQRAD